MSRTTKIVLGIVGGLVVLCVVSVAALFLVGRWALGQALTTDPTQAASLGHQIATYDLPAGYAEITGMNVAGVQMVMIGNKQQPGTIIMLAQFTTATTDPETMRTQMEQSLEQQSNQQGLTYTTVGQEDVTIKGETVTMTIREATSSTGHVTRQEEGVFTGNKGPAMVMITGSADTWDKDAVNQFLQSIR